MNYTKLATLAQRLIDKDGRDAVLNKASETPADVSKPWRGNTIDSTSLEVKAVFLKLKLADNKDIVRDGTQEALVSHNSTEDTDLRDFDTLVDSDTTWKIISAELVAPGDTKILWKLQLES